MVGRGTQLLSQRSGCAREQTTHPQNQPTAQSTKNSISTLISPHHRKQPSIRPPISLPAPRTTLHITPHIIVHNPPSRPSPHLT